MIDPRNPRQSAAKNNQIGIIVLAAGASRRMNTPKQLLEFEGETLLRRAVLTAIRSKYAPVVVVLGANFEKTRAEIEYLAVDIVFNAAWESGLASSLKAGLESLIKLAPRSAA